MTSSVVDWCANILRHVKTCTRKLFFIMFTKNKIYWNWELGFSDFQKTFDISIDDFVIPAYSKKSGCPIHKVKAFFSGMKPFDDVCKRNTETYIGGETSIRKTSKTIKTCPGVSELLKNSLVATFPTDAVISYNKSRATILSTSNSPHDPFDVEVHPLDQTLLQNGGNILDGRIALKINFPFLFSTQSRYTFLNPSWHSNVPWKVMSGVVNPSTSVPVTNPNIFLDLPLPESDSPEHLMHLEVKQGDPIAYIYFLDNPDVSNLQQDNELKIPLRKSFIRGFL